MSAAFAIDVRLDAALALAARGFRVFPCRPAEKVPAIEGWKQLATCNEEQIRAWWTAMPDCNVGIATGPMDDGRYVFVLDADLAKNGLASLQTLDARGLPATLTARTARGGRHLFFAVSAQVGATIGNSVGRLTDLPGLDVRADGGLVVGVGSEFAGRPYTWMDEAPIAEAPDFLVELVRAAKAPRKTFTSHRALVEEDSAEAIARGTWYLRREAPEAIEGDGGDETTFRVAAHLRDLGLGRERAFDLMSVHWNEAGKASPSWLPGDLRQKIDNAFLYAQNPLGVRLAAAEFDVVPGDDDMDGGPVDIFGHGDPGDLSAPPDGALPPMLARWVRSEARRKGVPEAFPAAAAVTAIAAAVGGSLRIQVRQHDTGWTEPAALWCVLVAPPGHVKSPTISAAVRPLQDQDQAFRREWKPKHAAWKKAAASRAANAPDPGLEPICRRSTVDNFTTEKLIRILADNPDGVLCTSDELMALLGSFGAYKTTGEGDRAHMLRMFDGGGIVVDRVSGDSLAAESALLSILAGTQPDKLGRLTEDLGADGLLQRFLFVMHDGQERQGLDEAPDTVAQKAYADLLRGLATAQIISDFAEPIVPTPAAGALLAQEDRDLRALKDLVGMGTAWPGHVEKWGKFLPRLVLTFHAAAEFERVGRVDPTLPIQEATVRMAVLFAHFLMRHSLAFHEAFGVRAPNANDALEIAGSLLLKPTLRTASHRDIYEGRRNLRGDDNRRRLFSAMEQLEAAGWVEAVEWRADGPSKWRIDARIHARFAEHAKRVGTERAERRDRIQEAGRRRSRLARNRSRREVPA